MTISRPALALIAVAAAVSGFWLTVHGPIRAQDDPPRRQAPSKAHIADAMLRPITLPFAEETSLQDVAKYLHKEIGANVVLDAAALDRLDLEPSSKVRLELTDVRLKTALKLLLDQVGLTTKVVAEDNLLILTDKAEADEPLERVLDELKALHRDLHALQDEVRDIRQLVELPPEDEPIARMRNPTIIEEKPADPGTTKPKPKTPPARPGV